MAFIQIIEYRTSKPGEMQAVAEGWAQATEGKRKGGGESNARTGTTMAATSIWFSSNRMKGRWRTRPCQRPIGSRSN